MHIKEITHKRTRFDAAFNLFPLVRLMTTCSSSFLLWPVAEDCASRSACPWPVDVARASSSWPVAVARGSSSWPVAAAGGADDAAEGPVADDVAERPVAGGSAAGVGGASTKGSPEGVGGPCTAAKDSQNVQTIPLQGPHWWSKSHR